MPGFKVEVRNLATNVVSEARSNDSDIYVAPFLPIGRYRGGVVVNVSVKSGTNTMHGALYHYFRNDKLNANAFESNSADGRRNSLRRPQQDLLHVLLGEDQIGHSVSPDLYSANGGTACRGLLAYRPGQRPVWYAHWRTNQGGNFDLTSIPWMPNIRDLRPPNLDFSIFKQFPITERMNLQLRAESFNLSNTPWFGNPNTTLGSASFGLISPSQANDPRNVQLVPRLSF